MDDSRFHDLVDMIDEKKQAFTSAEYLQLFNLLSKAFKMSTQQKEIIINNYRIYDDDSDDDKEEDTSYNDEYIKDYI
tara:strand:+ start:1372 stop:1602 length:231 start_codon:yes stop_codon:yes gene_type:complete